MPEYRSWNCLSEFDQKFRDNSGLLVFLRLERHLGDLTEDFVSKLDVVEFLGKDVQELSHRFRKMLAVLKGLYDLSLRGNDVSMMFHRETECLVNTHPDRFRLHMLFRLHDMVDRSRETSMHESENVQENIFNRAYVTKASKSLGEVHTRLVLSRSVREITARIIGI